MYSRDPFFLGLVMSASALITLSEAFALPPTPTNPVSSIDLTAKDVVPAAAHGQVKSILFNPYGEADGLRLANDVVIKFPPHLSQTLLANVQPGQQVRILGRPESVGMVKADVIINDTSGKVVVDQPPVNGLQPLPPHLRAQSLQSVQVEGKVDLLLTGPRGEVRGVILDNQSIVYFPPESLSTPLKRGEEFAAAGLGTPIPGGVSMEAIRMGRSLAQLQPLYDRP